MMTISLLLSIASIVVISIIGPKLGIVDMQFYFVSDCHIVLALFNGISSFMWFKNLSIPPSKTINTIAASSFGVLLIHANSDTMRQWLWKDTIDCIGHYDTSLYWLYAIVCVLAIYAVCTIIDFIRIKTIETPLLNVTERFCMNIYNKLNKK